ncbi:MAG: hypothetical protein JRJ21_07170 [Deltaproteobacteria bacterium]|nr:hypothetical protein [Deltaproteobacteria bacterium]
MKAQIKRLIDLQNCDSRISDVQHKKEQGPFKIRRLEEELIVFENKLKEELDQLEAYKQERRKIEREIEDLESRIEKSNTKLSNIKSNKEYSKAKIEKLRNDVEIDRNKIMEEMKALEQEFKRLEMERVSLGLTIDENLLKRYDFIRERKGGVVVSPVIKGVCQACHLDIPPQQFNELIRGEKMMACPNCIRIIYWGEDESFKNDAAVGEDVKE